MTCRAIHASLKCLTVAVMVLFLQSEAHAVFCPVRQHVQSNDIAGTIRQVRGPDGQAVSDLQTVRVAIAGTAQHTFANKDGYFRLLEVRKDQIVLRFEYAGRQALLDLGNVGLNKVLRLEGIRIEGERVLVNKVFTESSQESTRR